MLTQAPRPNRMDVGGVSKGNVAACIILMAQNDFKDGYDDAYKNGVILTTETIKA